jgi:hypothetical protein
MKSLMFISTKHLQILGTIVAAIAVFMMHDFVTAKSATDLLLSNDRVLRNVASTNPEKFVPPVRVASSGVGDFFDPARTTAEDVDLQDRGRRTVTPPTHVMGGTESTSAAPSCATLDFASRSRSSRSRPTPLLIMGFAPAAFDREPSASADFTGLVVNGSHAPES